MLEYVMLAAFIAAIAVLAVTNFGAAVSGLFTGVPPGL